MPDFFRIDEFAKTPSVTITGRDRTRLTSAGFDLLSAAPVITATLSDTPAASSFGTGSIDMPGWALGGGLTPPPPPTGGIRRAPSYDRRLKMLGIK